MYHVLFIVLFYIVNVISDEVPISSENHSLQTKLVWGRSIFVVTQAEVTELTLRNETDNKSIWVFYAGEKASETIFQNNLAPKALENKNRITTNTTTTISTPTTIPTTTTTTTTKNLVRDELEVRSDIKTSNTSTATIPTTTTEDIPQSSQQSNETKSKPVRLVKLELPEYPKCAEYPEDPDDPTPDYCFPSYKRPEKPDFIAMTSRISEAKCLEYDWELKDLNRRKVEKRVCKCNAADDKGIGLKKPELIILKDINYILGVIYREKLEKECKQKLYNHGTVTYEGGIAGRLTSRGEFSHMGAIGWKALVGTWEFKCGSSIISKKFVLTAAHCTKASPQDTNIVDLVPKIVRIGDRNIIESQDEGRTDAKISRIIVHEKYKAPIKYYDIALIELEEIIPISKYLHPACLWTKFSSDELGTKALGTGWGTVEVNSRVISPVLLAVDIDVLNTGLCDRLLMNYRNRNWGGFQSHQLCAGKLAGGTDTCQGDSGGPLQIPFPNNNKRHYIIGVISFGVGCALPNLPGVYTRVSFFLDWIESNVWGNQTIHL